MSVTVDILYCDTPKFDESKHKRNHGEFAKTSGSAGGYTTKKSNDLIEGLKVSSGGIRNKDRALLREHLEKRIFDKSRRRGKTGAEFVLSVLEEALTPSPSTRKYSYPVVRTKEGVIVGAAQVDLHGRDAYIALLGSIQRGAGGLVLFDIIQKARVAKMKSVCLQSEPNAVKFYEHFGFKKVGAPLRDQQLMKLRLG